MKKIYDVHHWHEINDDEELKKIGYFSSEATARAVAEAYSTLPGFRDSPPEVGWSDLEDERYAWEGGYMTYRYTVDEPEELVIDIPSWAQESRPRPNETTTAFAHRLMQSQGFTDYPQEPESEFDQLKQWAKICEDHEIPLSSSPPPIPSQPIIPPFPATESPQHIYDLSHFSPENDNVKGIGLFLSRAKAKEVMAIYKTYEGFEDTPKGFFIQRYTIDQLHWTHGYVTKVIPIEEKP